MKKEIQPIINLEFLVKISYVNLVVWRGLKSGATVLLRNADQIKKAVENNKGLFSAQYRVVQRRFLDMIGFFPQIQLNLWQRNKKFAEKKLHKKEIGSLENILQDQIYAVKYPIHYAVIQGDINCLKKLLSQLEMVDIFDDRLITPLEYAIYFKKFEIGELLLNFGANKDLFNIDISKDSRLYYQQAIDESLYKAASLIRPFMQDISIKKTILPKKNTHRKKIENPEELLENDEYIIKYPLHYAVIKGDIILVEKTVSKTKNIDLCDSNYVVALEYAIYQENLEISELLLSYGANKELFNIETRKSFDFYYRKAMEEGLVKTACMLRSSKEERGSIVLVEETQEENYKPTMFPKNTVSLGSNNLQEKRRC